MDWVALSRLLPEIALVGIFVWFVLELSKRQFDSQEARDTQWRDFLSQQSKQSNEAIGRIAEEVKAMTAHVAALNNLLLAHDLKERHHDETRRVT